MLRFTDEHEWLRLDGDVATIGITYEFGSLEDRHRFFSIRQRIENFEKLRGS